MTNDPAASPTLLQHRRTRVAEFLRRADDRMVELHGFCLNGRLTRVAGITLEASGCQAAVGARCTIETAPGAASLEAEVVGFSDDRLFLMPIGEPEGVAPGARVIPRASQSTITAGESLLGRVLDAGGAPLDGRPQPRCTARVALLGQRRNPLERTPIADSLDVGVRSLNGLLTIGRGQRIGLFASAGVGKSVLLGMMTRFTEADVVVVGLIGERGREVQEFIVNNLGSAGLARAVVVAAPADCSPLMRLHGAFRATAIAEYFRDQGLRVLLLMDSLTRFAQAQREIGLAIGEPPVTRGYPPSTFARLPQLVERAGTSGEQQGSITGIYTVLTEGEPEMDPIAESARAILDGHIVLSRRIADSGCFPAVDIESSVSRTMLQVCSAEQAQMARRFRQIYSAYEQNRDLITVGAYTPGTNPDVDIALQQRPAMDAFIQQDLNEKVSLADSVSQLELLCQKLGGN